MMHGGKALVGKDNPNYRTGRYSACIPDRLAGKYLEAQSDPDLIGLRDELSLVDARLADVLGRVDTKEAGLHWAQAQAAVNAYRQAPDAGKQAEAFEVIAASTDAGLSDYAAWGEVLALVEKRRRLCETETKRLSAMGQQITAERAMLLVSALVGIVRDHVSDQRSMRAITADVQKLLHRGDDKAGVS